MNTEPDSVVRPNRLRRLHLVQEALGVDVRQSKVFLNPLTSRLLEGQPTGQASPAIRQESAADIMRALTSLSTNP
jgi:hypothetical protein